MKLHLPKLLLTAVLAASCTAYAAEQWGSPQFGGPEYTWTGAGDGSSYTDGANWVGGNAPDRTSSDGPTLIFDGATATITNANKNSSDRGGIKALNGSIVSVGLGDWGGSIYVEEGSELTTGVGIQLKNTEQISNANVYAGGKLTITNSTLDFLDGNNWQNWQIDTNGQIDLTAMTEVKKNSGGWNLQYILPEHVTTGPVLSADTVSNRSYEAGTVEKQIVTSSISLASLFNSVTVINTSSNSVASDDLYEMTFGGNGNLTVSYTEEKYSNASLETSGEITWAHGAAGWVISGADGTDTSFLNGDTVKFAGNGSANLQGDITVNDLTVGEGVDYTVNMADDSSLYIQTRKDNFGGLKIVGNDSTSLSLRLSTDATHNGDSRVMLAEGSSLGAVYVDGVFAYNLHDGALESNLGGADLHLGNNGVLLLRNGLSGTVDANIKDIYFDGNNGEIRTYGNVTDATVADNIYASALQKTDTGAISLSGTVEAKSILVNGGSLTLAGTVKSTDSIMAGGGNINITGTATTGQLRLSEQGVGNVTISTGGKLSVTGTNNDHSTNASILLAHWGHDSKLTIAGGELDAQNTKVWMGWTGTGTLEITSGVASVKGLNFWAQGNSLKGHLILGSETGGTGRLNIGSDGITDACGDSPTVTLGNGTIGATADWVASYNGYYTGTVYQLIGTEGGTVFDTTDANDGVTARTITINNAMAGSGKLVKTGDGTLKVNGTMANFNGSLEVDKGAMEVRGTESLTISNLIVKNGATLTLGTNGNGKVTIGSTATTYSTQGTGSNVSLEGGATIVGSIDLSSTSILTLNNMDEAVNVTGDFVMPEGSLTLSGNILDALNSLDDNSTLTIFTVGGNFTLGGENITSDLTAESGYTLDTVFEGGSADYYLGFTAPSDANLGGAVYIGKVVPEPTTATLSLLALAALAARRRRK